MRKMRNWAQLIFVARKMRKFAPTRKPVALETLLVTHSCLTNTAAPIRTAIFVPQTPMKDDR